MSVTSILNEVVQNLENSPNLIRIKKVMFCACKGKWENDRTKLHNISVETLVKELYWKTQDIDKLYKIFDKILSKINKKTEYSLVVDVILKQVSKLYLEANEAKKENTDIPWLVNSAALVQETNQRIEKQPILSEELGNLFDVRFKLMQHSNPLKVKILIFSAIEREFNFSSQDWLQLRSISLDQLLQDLVKTFPQLPALEAHLTKVSSYLDKSDEMLQVVTVILESIKPLYQKDHLISSLSQKAVTEQPVKVKVSSSEKSLNREKQRQPALASKPSINRAIYQSFQHSNLSEIETLHLMEVENNEQFQSFPNPDLKLNNELIDIDSDLLSACSEVSHASSDHSFHSNQEALDAIFQLEDEIVKHIHQSISFTMSHMKTLLKDLEVEIDSQLQDYPGEVRAMTKYKALKKFMRHFQHQVMEFDQTLTIPDTTDHSAENNETVVESSTSNCSQPQNQNHVMELAKQGNCHAITNLINQSLNPRGINTLAKVRNGCLHVFLESEPVSTKEATAQFVHKKLIFLKIKSIQSIKIYGRQTGHKAIVWAQEFAYNHV
ncbi:MAG: hypothetical protein WBA77_02625 [Microcoleaceae cyanobacterium]